MELRDKRIGILPLDSKTINDDDNNNNNGSCVIDLPFTLTCIVYFIQARSVT
jgi:hypothetical protein